MKLKIASIAMLGFLIWATKPVIKTAVKGVKATPKAAVWVLKKAI